MNAFPHLIGLVFAFLRDNWRLVLIVLGVFLAFNLLMSAFASATESVAGEQQTATQYAALALRR